MINYSIVLFIMITVSIPLLFFGFFRYTKHGHKIFIEYVDFKIEYLNLVDEKVSLTNEFVCEYLCKDISEINTNSIEAMIFDEKFASEFGLENEYHEYKKLHDYDKKLKEEERIFFKCMRIFNVVMLGVSVGNLILTLK